MRLHHITHTNPLLTHKSIEVEYNAKYGAGAFSRLLTFTHKLNDIDAIEEIFKSEDPISTFGAMMGENIVFTV